MTWYLSVQAPGEPADLGELDDQGRIVYEFNILVQKRGGGVFLDELVQVLEDAGVGDRRVDIFTSSLAGIPDGDGPFLTIRETPGIGPTGTLQDPVAYRGPGAQILVRATSKPAASAMAQQAFVALLAVANRDVVAA